MVKVKEDMTGWKMCEHGVPDSCWTVLQRVEDKINDSGVRQPQWLCECSCDNHTNKIILGVCLKRGYSKSCGCTRKSRKRKYNKYDLSGEYGIGWTTNTNKEFYFDLDRYDELKNICWNECVRKGFHFLIGTDLTTKKTVYMHTFLGYKYHDHINRNQLDNRSCNLRPCTQQENVINKSIRIDNTSGISGVSWNTQKKKWIATLQIGGKKVYFGGYCNKDDAIKARLNGELQYFGEFAPQKHLYEQYCITESTIDGGTQK